MNRAEAGGAGGKPMKGFGNDEPGSAEGNEQGGQGGRFSDQAAREGFGLGNVEMGAGQIGEVLEQGLNLFRAD